MDEQILEPIEQTDDSTPDSLLGEEQPENKPEQDTAAQSEEFEEVELSSLDDLISHYEWDPEWVNNIKVPVKVNHETNSIPLADLKASYEIGQATRAELDEAKQKASSIIAEANKQKDQMGASLAQFSKLLESVESEINRDVSNIDWSRLRSDDPAEHAAKKQEISERRERLKELKANAERSYQQYLSQIQQQQQAALEKSLPEERQKLLQRVPEWENEEKAKAEQAKVVKYLSSEGFSEQDIQAAAYNGQVLALAVKAMRYDESKATANAAKKKVVKIPKTLKPGSKADQKPKQEVSNDPIDILYG